MPSSHEWSGSSLADPDDELLQQAREAPEGDLRAFEKLVLRYQRRVVANCRYITRDPNNAEDLAQEVLVKAFFGLRGFEGRSTFGSWLQRIKINHCLNYLKKQAGRSYVGVEERDVEEFDQLKVHAKLVEVVLRTMLVRIRFDSLVEKAGVDKALQRI